MSEGPIINLKLVVDDQEVTDAELRHKHKLAEIGLKVEIAKHEAEEALEEGIKAEEQAEIAKKAAEEAVVTSRKSFHMVMTGMRTSYLMFAGLGRIMGGGMTMMFRTMYSVGMATVGFYKSIAGVKFATMTPLEILQATMMLASLGVASAQLVGVMTGQKDLARNMRGFNMMLHGISGMIGSYSVT